MRWGGCVCVSWRGTCGTYNNFEKYNFYESVQIANVTNRVQYTRYIWLCLKKIKNIQSDRDVHNAMCILSSVTMLYICYFKKIFIKNYT